MTDCLTTLHILMRDPAELAAAQADIGMAWCAALAPAVASTAHRPAAAEPVRFVATGAAARRLRCPSAKKIIVTTETDWSKSCALRS